MNTQTAAPRIPASLDVLKSFTLCVSLSLTILFLSGSTNLNAEETLPGGEEILKKYIRMGMKLHMGKELGIYFTVILVMLVELHRLML